MDSATSSNSIIDLFAGPGGLDVAAHWLGLQVKGIEWDDGACATRQAAGLETVHGDVRSAMVREYGAFNVLAAGPPCQTFTVAGKGSGRAALELVKALVKSCAVGDDISGRLSQFSDERTGLVLQPLAWVLWRLKRNEPFDGVLLEQVPAVLPVWHAIEVTLQDLGYKTEAGILRTEEYGVPQTRRRAVLIANRHFQPRLPVPTHQRFPDRRNGELELDGPPRWTSMRDALSIIPNNERHSMYEIVSNYGSGGNPAARGRRNLDEPAFTVTGKVSRNRFVDRSGQYRGRVAASEAGVLQTFPFDYPWRGRDISQQIGNAIPPRLGVHILAAALGLSFDHSKLDKAVRLSWSTSKNGCIPTWR
ncbi:DNA cytosine methyltransferase [Gordonia sp. NPDC003429]